MFLIKELIMRVKKKLLDLVREKIQFKHYSYSTEKTYVHWIKHYIFFHSKKHPIEMGKREIEMYLTKLATEDNVAPTTQNQAFSALLFLYKEVLGIDMSEWNIQALPKNIFLSKFKLLYSSIVLSSNHKCNFLRSK